MNPKDRVVIVGAGLAGCRAATELRRLGHRGSLTLVGLEAETPYDRPPLSKGFLTGDVGRDRVVLPGIEAADVDLRLGVSADSVGEKHIHLSDGEELRWEALIVATGSRPVRPAFVPTHQRVDCLRTLEDAVALRYALAKARSLVIVGGGFIGAEVATSARGLGLEVTVIEACETLMAEAVGTDVGQELMRRHEADGVRLMTGTRVTGIDPGPASVKVLVSDGRAVVADHVLVSLGARPNTGLLVGSGADLADGIACDRHGQVDGLDHVFAVGDCASWRDREGRHRRREHWSSAGDQASIVAHHLMGIRPPDPMLGPPYFWSDQAGTKLQLLGRPELADRGEWLERSDTDSVHAYYRGDTLVAVATIGAPRLLARYRPAVAEGLDGLARVQIG